MTHNEANIYLIKNLNELNCSYRVYEVLGLARNEDRLEEHYRNCQYLIDKLSRITQSPCHYYTENDRLFIAQLDGSQYKELPGKFDLIRTQVVIEKQPDLKELNFNSLDGLTSLLAERFLQFCLQAPLYHHPDLWQPGTGGFFYIKTPDKEFRSLSGVLMK